MVTITRYAIDYSNAAAHSSSDSSSHPDHPRKTIAASVAGRMSAARRLMQQRALSSATIGDAATCTATRAAPTMESPVASTASARSPAAVDQDAVLRRPSAQLSRLTVVATVRAATTVDRSY